MRARSQIYAELIFEKTAEIKGMSRKDQKRYGALCHRFPFLVRENGLAAALGFLAAKGGANSQSPENCLLVHYASVLRATSADNLRNTVNIANLDEYRRVTRETLYAAEWFKRYAEAVLKVDSTGAGDEEEEIDSD